jgi:release factor glutamine methyltransferase
LRQARDMGVDRLDAQLILARRLGVHRTWLLAHGDDPVDADRAAAVLDDLARRATGQPLAYLFGEREFHGLLLSVTPAVLDPRPDTEILVDWALELLNEHGESVVDLGTGTGAIALAVKHARPHVDMLATDVDDAALAVARSNAARLGLQVAFATGNWWDATPGRQFDLVLSNPPYIAAADPHLRALHHEPPHALTPGPTGLEAIQCIVAGAAVHMGGGAWLVLEHGHDQAAAVQDCLRSHGFLAVTTRADLAGLPRCTGGRRPR